MKIILFDFWIVLFRCWIDAIFYKQSKYALAWKSYQTGYIFYDIAWDKDIWIALRFGKHAIQQIFKSPEDIKIVRADTDTVFYSIGKGNFTLTEYTEICSSAPIGFYLNDENTHYGTTLTKSICLCGAILGTIVLFIRSLFASHRGRVASYLAEMLSLIRLAITLQTHHKNRLIYVGGFSRFSNFSILLLERLGITTQKVPSPNPLKNYYQINICDTFTYTAPFQKQEYPALKANWRVNHFEQWPVVNFQHNLAYLQRHHATPPRTLALCVSGIWYRKANGDNNPSNGVFEAEEQLIDALLPYLHRRKDLHFMIFLHPLEKKTEEVYARAKAYYQEKLAGITIHFFDRMDSTHSHFMDADLMLSPFSTTGMDRIFCGYKTIYGPFGMRSDYFTDENILRISAQNPEELYTLLDETMNISHEAFFEKYNLWDYHYNTYPTYIQKAESLLAAKQS